MSDVILQVVGSYEIINANHASISISLNFLSFLAIQILSLMAKIIFIYMYDFYIGDLTFEIQSYEKVTIITKGETN